MTPQGNIKLSNYGLFYMTEYGYCVDFSVINWATLAPECYAIDAAYDCKHSLSQEPATNNKDKANIELNSSKADVWALGSILFQFVYGLSSHTESSQEHLSALLTPPRIVSLTIELLASKMNIENDNKNDGYEHMMRLYEIDEKKRIQIEAKTKPYIIELIKKSLRINASKRPTFHELIKIFEQDSEICDPSVISEDCWDAFKRNLFATTIRSDHISLFIKPTRQHEK